MGILNSVLAYQDHLIALRRQIHQHPELGWQEKETQSLILRELKELGIPCETVWVC